MLTRHILAALCATLLSAPFAELQAQEAAATPPPDRIELSNGDVVTGEVTAVKGGEVIINSPSLGEITVPADQIASISTHHPIALQLDGGERFDGRIEGIQDGAWNIVADSKQRRIAVGELVERQPPVLWSGSISAGASLASGNTDRRGAALTGEAMRKTDDTRLTLRLTWNYAQDKDRDVGVWTLTQRKTYGSGQFDYLFTERFYGYALATGENDQFADLKLRVTLGAGAGYTIFDSDRFSLSGEAGISRIEQDFYSSTPDEGYWAARLGYDMRWEIITDETLLLLSNGQIFPSLEDADNVFSRMNTSLRWKMMGDLFAQLQWIWEWNNMPTQPDDPAAAPTLHSDHQVFLTFGWAF